MKRYRNGAKATEFTSKQIGVIFAKAKKGELKVEKWFMKRMYSLSDYYGYDDNRGIENEEQGILQILEAVFAGDIEKAQRIIDRETDFTFSAFTESYRETFDRGLVV